MTGKRLVGVGLALLFAGACSDVSTVEPLHVPSAHAAKNPTVFQGEKINANSVINVLYNWDVGASGPVVYASRPMGPDRWPGNWNPKSSDEIYVVVYPIGTTVTGLMCYDTPNETCPDHGPDVAAGAMAIHPAVYGGGVLGHDHMGPAHLSHATATFMLFTDKAFANNHITSKAQVLAEVAAGRGFLVPVPSLSFMNAPVDGRVYELATPWICPPYTFCQAP